MSSTARICKIEGKSPISISSVAEFREHLVQLHDDLQGQLVTLMIEFPDGRLLMIGVGGLETYVVVHEPIEGSQWTSEWITVGDTTRTDEIYFTLDGHHTPHPGSSVLPWPVALECACRYFEAGERLPRITWEENQF